MCYTTEIQRKANKETQLKLAEKKWLQNLQNNLQFLERDLFAISGFAHPKLPVLTHPNNEVEFMAWGFIPSWTRTFEDGKKFWNNTLNARGETIFEKSSFRNSARSKRCIIYLNSFYEYHHLNGKTFPFRIKRKDGLPLIIAGLWEEWVDKTTGEIFKTCIIVTTSGNKLMSLIHNNPKSDGPRMPVLLHEEEQVKWLTEIDESRIKEMIKPVSDNVLEAYPVGKISGKGAIGNAPEILEEVQYSELEKFW